MQDAEIDADLHTRLSKRPNTSSVRICRKLVQRFPRSDENPILSRVTLTFDLNVQTHPSEGATKHVFCVNLSQIRWSVPEIPAKNPVFVCGQLDFRTRMSEGPNLSSANQFSNSRDICRKLSYLFLVTMTFDIQIRLSKGPSTSSM